MASPAEIAKLVAIRDELLKMSDALRDKIAGLDMAIKIVAEQQSEEEAE